MSISLTTAPTQILETSKEKYAYRRVGPKTGTPLADRCGSVESHLLGDRATKDYPDFD